MRGHQPFRIEPRIGPEFYKTYSIFAPLSTHWRKATCAEVSCPNHLKGWAVLVDESAELGQLQAHYIRHDKSRRFTEYYAATGGLTRFEFEPGQRCFKASEHRVRTGRDEIYVVQGGDWRATIGAARKHARAADWVDDFADHQIRLSDIRTKG